MDTKKIIVTGANGQLGKAIHDISGRFPQFRFYFLGREHFALEQYPMVIEVMKALRPDFVINAAAYTAVDKAETSDALANLINGESVGHLAGVCAQHHCALLHVSTDYVFDGTKTTPYTEDDATNPLGVYGASKLTGEQLAMANNAQTVIVRTSWVYSRHGNNFVKTMLRLMKEKAQIGVVNDQYGCPTWAQDLAEALLQICDAAVFTPGIFHYSNTGPITWFQLASAIRDLISSQCIVNPILTSDFPTLAQRPAFSCMSNQKIEQVYGLRQKDWRTSLKDCLESFI